MTNGAELRFDLVSGEWVGIVGDRQDRPNLPEGKCPFCVGGIEAPTAYDVRAFENRWPPYEAGPPADLGITEPPRPARAPARGASEVVLYSPSHEGSMATLGVDQIAALIELWVERSESLLARPEIRSVLIFENRGAEVGATIHHPHGQIYGYPFVPPVPRDLAERAELHGDPIAAELDYELGADVRLVTRRGCWTAYVPFASGYPYGLRVVPTVDAQRLVDLSTTDRHSLAEILVDLVARYDSLFPGAGSRTVPFPYLMWINQAPDPRPASWFRLHVQFAPPWREAGVARFVASGELGSGTLSNPVPPEHAAAALRGATGLVD